MVDVVEGGASDLFPKSTRRFRMESLTLLHFVHGSLSSGRELAQFVSYHFFIDRHWNEALSIVDVEGKTHEFRQDHGTSRPSLNLDLGFGSCFLELTRFDDLLQQRVVDKGSLPDRSGHDGLE